MRFLSILFLLVAPVFSQARWTEKQANEWYAKQPWLVGSNYIPATAINQLEMWQADTFDAVWMDTELGWAEGLGMNTMRVFLHDLPWKQDPSGFRRRIDTLPVHRRQSRHPSHLRAVRFLLGSVSGSGATARAQAGCSQFGLDAESGRELAARSERLRPPAAVRAGSDRRLPLR